MCERFALYQPLPELRDHFSAPDDGFNFGPRYNLAPGQVAPVVRSDSAGRRAFMPALWGLIPAWARVTETLSRPINAKAETAAIERMFRHAFRQCRILIPANAYYEWELVDGQKQPYLVHMKNGEPFGMGGLLEFWQGPVGEVATFTILTTTANALMARIHNRMPVIIRPENYAEWLDPGVNDINRLHTLIGSYAETEMGTYPVSKDVNSPTNDGAELLEPRFSIRETLIYSPDYNKMP